MVRCVEVKATDYCCKHQTLPVTATSPPSCVVPSLSFQPEETIGKGIRAHKRSAVDALWAEMNAGEALPVGAGSSTSKGKGQKSKKKKAEKKANQASVYF